MIGGFLTTTLETKAALALSQPYSIKTPSKMNLNALKLA